VIVGPRFDGDDYEALQWKQHDAYHQALAIIVQEALGRLKRAEALLGPSALGDLVRQNDFDHHVLQDAHDLIAAIWRARHGHTHPTLPLAGLHIEKAATEWLDWLRSFVRAELDDRLMRSVLIVGYVDPDPEHTEERYLLDELERRLKAAVADRPA
jgi:hypothetical protein